MTPSRRSQRARKDASPCRTQVSSECQCGYECGDYWLVQQLAHLRGVCPYTCFCGCRMIAGDLPTGSIRSFSPKSGATMHTTGPFRLARKTIPCKYSQTEIQYVSKLLIEQYKVIGNVYGSTRCACALMCASQR